MHIQTKFIRLRKPVSLGDCIDDWQVCWGGGWDKCPVFFVVNVVNESDVPDAHHEVRPMDNLSGLAPSGANDCDDPDNP
jgi:hypothetical protein